MADQLATIDLYPIMAKAANAARAEMEKNKANNNHRSLWQYDKVVDAALKEYVPEDREERRKFYVEIQKLAREEDVKAGTPFGVWSGFTIVGSCLSDKIAWLTPGWAEVRQYLS